MRESGNGTWQGMTDATRKLATIVALDVAGDDARTAAEGVA